MMLFVCTGRTRTFIFSFLSGVLVCLFCGEVDGYLIRVIGCSRQVFTCNVTPLVEEIFKAFPVFVYAFTERPSRQHLMEYALAVGVGFAVLENAFILASNLASNPASVSIPLAIIRGFGSGMMHGICTMAVGFFLSYVHTRRKLFFPGTIALLVVATVYHSIYNRYAQSAYPLVAFLLPTVTFIPILLVLRKRNRL